MSEPGQRLIETKPCEGCGALFRREGSGRVQSKWAKARFCSRDCSRRNAYLRKETLGEALLARSRREENGCLVWTGYRVKKGYGRISIAGRSVPTNRAAYQAWIGEIPADQLVCHKCDNPPCIEPSHLFLGTNAENLADRNAKGRQSKGESRNGAKLTETAVRAIRASDAPTVELAALYGVAETTLSYARHGKTWTHVTPETNPHD